MERSSSDAAGVRTRSSARRNDNAAFIAPTTGVIDLSCNTHIPPASRVPAGPSCALDTRIPLLSPSPSSSSPSSCSSASPTHSDPDDAWNLVPYHISWGHEYQEYRAGTLPGPEGDCIFLRSPTPLKNQRTTEACKKCRERKAKCTGGRPGCARCTARNYVCEYASEIAAAASSASDASPAPERLSSVAKNRKRRRDAAAPPTDAAAPPTDAAAPPTDAVRIASGDGRVSGYDAMVPVKLEDGPLLSFDTLGYPDSPTSATNWEGSTPSDEYSSGEPWAFAYPQSPLGSGDVSPTSFFEHDMATFIADEGARMHGGSAHAGILAPQPVRRSSVVELESGETSEGMGMGMDVGMGGGAQGGMDTMMMQVMYGESSGGICSSSPVEHELGYGIPVYIE
ncbi:hypothetical protein OF83DRAFT_1082944 [Amylostereum chailletii]|nr:hypothetical protein OF83DRAFT_1082944 [Amylostereum chailletii]